MKVWITKYALSDGIKELAAEQSDYSPDMVFGKVWNDCYHGEGKEWHRTYESAVVRMEEMRQKRISSLQKQIEKLEKMRSI